MPTIDPGSLSMSYERIDTVILRGRAIGTSIGMEGSGLTGRSRTCVQTHVHPRNDNHAVHVVYTSHQRYVKEFH